MSDDSIHSHSAMEGKGAYNRHAELPAVGAALALPHLQKAIENMQLHPAGPLVIADYGSSEGKNSLAPIKLAVEELRRRAGPGRAILIYHVDRSSNDFNSLFEALDRDPDRYVSDKTNIFPCAIGKSFYEKVLPRDYVDIGWSSYAAMWISRIPSAIPGHFFVPYSTGSVRAEFDRQAALDWETFLSLRASELRPGGRLIVVMPGADDNGISRSEGIMDPANAVLAEMVDEGAITAEERARMVLGAWPRRRRDLLAPFERGGQFCHLTVEHCDTSVLTDFAWADYERDGNPGALAAKHALFFCAIVAPTLASALTRVRAGEPGASQMFGDRLENGLRRRLAIQPTPLHSLVETIVLAKQGASK